MSRDQTASDAPLDRALADAFAAAAACADTMPIAATRALIERYGRERRRHEAQRQSLLIAAAPDAEATMDAIDQAQAWLFWPAG